VYWAGIWNLKVSPKVKNLIWRMCRGCLLTQVRLLDKGVTCSTNCASCDSTHEDLLHVFFACPFALQVWNKTGLWGSMQHAISTTDSATEAILYMLANLSTELTQRLTSVIWNIWKHHNLRVWNDETVSSTKVVEKAINMVEDWKMANIPAVLASNSNHQQAMASTSQQHQIKWQPHVVGRYKCNIDAAFSSQVNRTIIGICVRDTEGTFVLAKTMTYPCNVQVDVGEALGLYTALQWLSDMQIDNVDFETDSKLTTDVFLSTRNDLSKFGCIISSCRSLFSTFFSNSRVEFVRRQANVVAHALAREAMSFASPAVYFELPNCIETLIINEML